jgi:hypothetical protein
LFNPKNYLNVDKLIEKLENYVKIILSKSKDNKIIFVQSFAENNNFAIDEKIKNYFLKYENNILGIYFLFFYFFYFFFFF